jgi:hypothetical protein
MKRAITIAAAQMGPNQPDDSREAIMDRIVALVEKSAAAGADLVVLPELALTTFFPRYVIDDEAELDSFCETEVPGPSTPPSGSNSASMSASPNSRKKTARRSATTPPSWSIPKARSSANTARSICPAPRRRWPNTRASSWRSAISQSAISASR